MGTVSVTLRYQQTIKHRTLYLRTITEILLPLTLYVTQCNVAYKN
jgi:hypothetical protein